MYNARSQLYIVEFIQLKCRIENTQAIWKEQLTTCTNRNINATVKSTVFNEVQVIADPTSPGALRNQIHYAKNRTLQLQESN